MSLEGKISYKLFINLDQNTTAATQNLGLFLFLGKIYVIGSAPVAKFQEDL